MNKRSFVAIFAAGAMSLASLGVSTSASAEGFGVTVLRGMGVVTKDQGEIIDGAHDQFKRANPSYGEAEERLTNDTREAIGLERHCEPIFNKWGKQVGCQ